MGVSKLVKRVRGRQLCCHLFFGDPLHQRRKAPLARKITHKPIDEPVSSAHPAKRQPTGSRETRDDAYVFACSSICQLRERSANKPAVRRQQPRCEDGPCLVEAHGVEYQIKTSLPFRVMTRNAFNRSTVVRDHVIRATLACKFLILAAAHADNERSAHAALCDLNCEMSDPA